jgi:hypothetical protein
MNENGELFINLCASYDLVMGGFFTVYTKKKNVTKSHGWMFPTDHSTKNQTDHIAISRKFRRSVTNIMNV